MKVYFSVLWWLQEDDPVYLLERHEVRFLKVIYIRNVDVCFEFLSTKKWDFCTWQIISLLSVDWINPETYSVLLTVRTIWCDASKQYWHKMFDFSLRWTRDQRLQPSILKSAEIPFLSGPRLPFQYFFFYFIICFWLILQLPVGVDQQFIVTFKWDYFVLYLIFVVVFPVDFSSKPTRQLTMWPHWDFSLSMLLLCGCCLARQ